MIPQSRAARQAETDLTLTAVASWQQSLADVIRTPQELFDTLELQPGQQPAATLAAMQEFPLRVPREFVARMQPGDWNDPLLQQVLPLGQEMDYQPGFCQDPLEENAANPVPGLIHKYHGRVLLVISGGCAIHCRYCFRRHFPYEQNNPSRRQWQQALDYIRADDSIREVIFSGGDPLVASDRLLAELTAQLSEIPHLTTLRLHSRLPVVIPSRIDDHCLAWLTGHRLRPVMVIHSNHANEIDVDVQRALQRLQQAGVTTLNQTVLLKGINDNEQALAQLSERLFAAGCLPYYLHLLDKVQGAQHFEVSAARAQQLAQALLARLPGYLVPKLVQELPGAASKVPLPVTQP